MMRGGDLLYKCRRCGAERAAYHAPDAMLVSINIVAGVPQPRGWGHSPGWFDWHSCEDGVMGVCDFVGYREDPEKPGEKT